MRKISIVQRRLETGLDLTQAELRALQREACSSSIEEEDSESTITAVKESLSFLPPTRLPEVSPQQDLEQLTDLNNPPEGDLRREDVGNRYENESIQIIDAARGTSDLRKEDHTDEPSNDSTEYTESSDTEGFFSRASRDLRAAMSGIFAGESFSSDAESTPAFSGQKVSSDDEYLADGWESQREVLFPSQRAQEEVSNKLSHLVSGESPVNQPISKEETLVLFLVQVPEGDLEATFIASQEAESPFAGQLRLCSEGNAAQPGEASEFDVNLPPEGLVRLSMGRIGNNGHRWALISLDEEARAYATFDLRAGRNLKATAAVFSKKPSRVASVPLETSLSEDSGLVLANPTEESVTVKLSLYNDDGNQVSSLTSHDPLPPGKQIAVFAKGIFGDTPGIGTFRGKMVAEVVGKGLIWSAGLDQNDGILSFLPVNDSGQSAYPPC